MTATQTGLTTRMEPLVVGMTLISRDYRLRDLSRTLDDLGALVYLLARERDDRDDMVYRSDIRVTSVRLGSPLEVWLAITASATATVLLAERLVGLFSGIHEARAEVAEANYRREAYRIALARMQNELGRGSDPGFLDRLSRFASTVAEITIIPPEQPAAELGLPPVKPSGDEPLSAWERELLSGDDRDDERDS